MSECNVCVRACVCVCECGRMHARVHPACILGGRKSVFVKEHMCGCPNVVVDVVKWVLDTVQHCQGSSAQEQ